jgi:hypothetical protein
MENSRLKKVRDDFIANRKQRRPFTATNNSSIDPNQTSGAFLKDANYLRRQLDK